MPIYIQDVEKRRIGTSVAPLTQPDNFPGTFPMDLWVTQLERYLQYWRQFTGDIWNEEIPNTFEEDGTPHLRYPLQINYLKTICMKHSYVLWGEVADSPLPLAPVRCTPRDEDETGEIPDETKKLVKRVQNFINNVWVENDGRALQQEGGLTQSYLGGYVLRMGWSPEDPDLYYKIRLENVLPDFFLPIWDNGHPGDLLECWIAYRMPAREAALRFPEMGIPFNAASDPFYVEHWTKDTVEITLNNKPLIYTVNGITLDYTSAENPFGFVPFEYIPRERSGGYFGLSLLDDLVAEAKEMNARMADMGDAVFEIAHREVFFKNLTRSPGTIDYGGTRPGIDLGSAPPGSPGEPEAMAINPPTISPGIADYPETVRKQLQRDSFTPGVAEGEDEGSQRSALTLAFRMWPLTAKIRAVRTYWTVGLIRAGKKIAKMGILKGKLKVPMAILDLIDWSIEWSPMIPRDREQELNELVLSVQANIISPEDALANLNLVDDPVAGYNRVKEWLTWQAKLQASIKMAGGSGSSTTGSTPPPVTKTTGPVAESIMSEPKS